MSEQEIYERVSELQNDGSELYNFVAENCDVNLSEAEIDDLVSDFETDTLSLREFVINVLED
mgnify:CR=1 FL=1